MALPVSETAKLPGCTCNNPVNRAKSAMLTPVAAMTVSAASLVSAADALSSTPPASNVAASRLSTPPLTMMLSSRSGSASFSVRIVEPPPAPRSAAMSADVSLMA